MRGMTVYRTLRRCPMPAAPSLHAAAAAAGDADDNDDAHEYVVSADEYDSCRASVQYCSYRPPTSQGIAISR